MLDKNIGVDELLVLLVMLDICVEVLLMVCMGIYCDECYVLCLWLVFVQLQLGNMLLWLGSVQILCYECYFEWIGMWYLLCGVDLVLNVVKDVVQDLLQCEDVYSEIGLLVLWLKIIMF